jgi:capsular polysaccharide export protein
VTLYGFDFFSTLHIARQDKTKHFLHNPTIEKQAIFEIINRDPTIQIKGYEHTRPSEYYRIPSKVFLLNFSPVNEKYFTALFPYATIDTVPREITLIDLDLSVLRYTSLFIWNYLSQKEEAFLDKHRLKVIRVTDGFIHPNDKKNRFTPPYSWCFDAGGLYFNPNSSSFLFYLLNQGQLPESLRLFGKKVLQSYLGFQTNNSQYLTLKLSSSAYNPKLKKRVLVIGQLKDEPSTIFGMKNGMEDIELIKLAITENPGADIIYRCGSRHPYTHTDKPELSFSNEIKSLVSIASFEISLADILLSIDHVYTMTSYDGFEAILRGIKTTVFGIPFYAGWGLTDDRENILGRHRKLSTLELFITVIILYPRYMTNNTFSDIESIMNIINPIRDHKSVSYAH